MGRKRKIWRGREKTQILNKRNKRSDITMDTTDFQRIIREYWKQLYTNKFDNLDKMDKFIERYKLSKQTQEETKSE